MWTRAVEWFYGKSTEPEQVSVTLYVDGDASTCVTLSIGPFDDPAEVERFATEMAQNTLDGQLAGQQRLL